ncbi:MAG: DrmB family protein [Thermoleophilia bacterium]
MARERAHGQMRRSQVITTWGPGALLDLPRHSGIVGGLDTWGKLADLDEIFETRLTRKLEIMTGVTAPRLYAPPTASDDLSKKQLGITVWRFPEWFLVQEAIDSAAKERSRRVVHRRALDNKERFDGHPVIATRFVRACPRGHVDDLDWSYFVHGGIADCPKEKLWLDEQGTSGDLSDLYVRCGHCRTRRPMFEATDVSTNPLGTCPGRRPWLGLHASEPCTLPSRLLIRTATNAYFTQVVSVLSLPERGKAVDAAVAELWSDLQIVDTATELAFLQRKPQLAEKLAAFSDDDILGAITRRKKGTAEERPVKLVELDALLAVPMGYGDDVPIDPDFHGRRLPDSAWRHTARTENVSSVIQLHRLREVLALCGFTRFEAESPDIDGEYKSDVERAHLALDPQWFPAVENRGEGVFLQLKTEAVQQWLERSGVRRRLDQLAVGHNRWTEGRKLTRDFPGGPYVLLHTLSHLLLQSLSMRCGYPASSLRERIYADAATGHYGLLLYTGSPDTEGTLGGLVQEARRIEDHLALALRSGALCSNDPICAQHEPGVSLESRWLHGAACHGCTLVSETSCEMRNDYLDRALVVPALGVPDAAFFSAVG